MTFAGARLKRKPRDLETTKCPARAGQQAVEPAEKRASNESTRTPPPFSLTPPSPARRGSDAHRLLPTGTPPHCETGLTFPLSQRERAGVRVKAPYPR